MSFEDGAILFVLGVAVLLVLALRAIGNKVEDMQRQDEEAFHPPLVEEFGDPYAPLLTPKWSDENHPPARKD